MANMVCIFGARVRVLPPVSPPMHVPPLAPARRGAGQIVPRAAPSAARVNERPSVGASSEIRRAYAGDPRGVEAKMLNVLGSAAVVAHDSAKAAIPHNRLHCNK